MIWPPSSLFSVGKGRENARCGRTFQDIFTARFLAVNSLSFFALFSLLIGSNPALWAYDGVALKRTTGLTSAPKRFVPVGVAWDPGGRLWVTDSGNGTVTLFSPEGDFVQSYGRHGSAVGQWNDPHGIAVDGHGTVFVADSGNQRIQVLGSDGKFQRTLGEKGSGAGQFVHPWALAISHDGVLAVSERDSTRILVFTTDGVFLQAFETNTPTDGLAFDLAGRLYTVHDDLKEINQWSIAGQLLKTFTGVEPGVRGFAKPTGIAVADSGLLYVTDAGAGQFRELDGAGHSQGAFGRAGSGEGQFRTINAIAIQNETVAIADAKNHRVSLLTLSRQTPMRALTPLPTFKISLHREPSLAVDVDRLVWSPSGLLDALSFSRDELVTINPASHTTTPLDLKKTVGLRSPGGLASASTDALFISDTAGNRVIKMSREGKLELEIGKAKGFFKSGQGDLSKPEGLTCSTNGMVLVANTGNKRIDVFNSQGLFQFSGGEKGSGSGQLQTPVSVAWDKHRLYVADPGNHKVAVFNSSGRWLADLGALGSESLVEPRQVSVDKEGYLFVLDAARGRISVFSPEGEFVSAFGALGHSEGFLDHPRGFALSDTNELYVAEANSRIQVFHVALLPPAPTAVSAVASDGYVTVQWDAVKTRFPARYSVYRSTPGAEAQKIKETVDTKITDDTLTEDTTCLYTIVAQSIQGSSSAPSTAAIVMAHASRHGPALEIVNAQIDDVFSADYKSYGRTPFGHIQIRNNGPATVSKINVAFEVTDFMDFPSEVPVAELHANESTDIPLTATFNNHILQVSETTEIQAQLKLTYYSGDGEQTVVKRLPFKLYSRNSIRWDQKERAAAFVTPNDPPLLDFARGVTTPFLDAHQGAPLPMPVINAWAVFSGLGAYGIHYLERPNNPYDRVSLDSNTVDSLQYARETLARKSGDCADMVALLASALESVTVTTVALDAPGHLFLMMDTGESNLKTLGFPKDDVVFYAGTYWIPLEATMIGSPFLDAWKQGAQEVRRWSAQNKLSMIDIHLAWEMYEPVTLPESTDHLNAPTRQAIETVSLADWKAVVERRWQTRFAAAKEMAAASPHSGQPWIEMGMLAVQYHRYDEARQFFVKAKADPATAAAAANNLGNLAYLKGDTHGAEAAYHVAQQADPKDAQINLNLTRVYLKSGQTSKASAAYGKAMTLNSTLKDRYPEVSSLQP